jgi:hypothetical protein
VFYTATGKWLFCGLIYAIIFGVFAALHTRGRPWAFLEKWGLFTIIAKVWCLDIRSLADTDAA